MHLSCKSHQILKLIYDVFFLFFSITLTKQRFFFLFTPIHTFIRLFKLNVPLFDAALF
jgi:hypothetical protein